MLYEEVKRGKSIVLDLVHPHRWDFSTIGVRDIVKDMVRLSFALPKAILRAIKRRVYPYYNRLITGSLSFRIL